MQKQTFKKFIRPGGAPAGPITDRDLDLLDAILRYRFSPASQLVRLVGGNEDVTHRRLRRLWERGPNQSLGVPRHSQPQRYYLDSREPLSLLAERRGWSLDDHMLEEVRNHREKDYAAAAVRGQHMQLGFLQHSLMISQMHFMVEMACRKSGGNVVLETWCQGSQIAGHKAEVPKVKSSRQGGDIFWQETAETESLPVELDALFTLRFRNRPASDQLAHFFYEADRGTMTTTDMLRKFRAYLHFIKKQQRHREDFGIHPIRAVLTETTSEARGKNLMTLVNHPLVSGPGRRAGLFWFTISPLFTDPTAINGDAPERPLPRYLREPQIVMDQIWALPDRSILALGDAENSPDVRS